MRLSELSAQWLMVTGARTRQRVDAMHPAKADGIIFLCPKCFAANGGPTGTHSVICWQPKIPKKIKPGPGRWSFEGTSFDDLTLVAGSSSIHLTGKGCGAHFFIRNGMIQGS